MEQTLKAYQISEIEKLLGVKRWRINYAQRYHGAKRPSIRLGNQNYYTEDDLNDLIIFFENDSDTEL